MQGWKKRPGKRLHTGKEAIFKRLQRHLLCIVPFAACCHPIEAMAAENWRCSPFGEYLMEHEGSVSQSGSEQGENQKPSRSVLIAPLGHDIETHQIRLWSFGVEEMYYIESMLPFWTIEN